MGVSVGGRGEQGYSTQNSKEPVPICCREHYTTDASQMGICRSQGTESVRCIYAEGIVKMAANLDEKDARALKARLEAQLASLCGDEWCVGVYRAKGRWLARAYRRGEHTRGPKPGTNYRPRCKQPHGGNAASGTGGASPSAAPK